MIDKATGLPELPKGQHWKVSFYTNILGSRCVKVQVRTWFRPIMTGEKYLTNTWGIPLAISEYPAVIEKLAEAVLLKLQAEPQRKAEAKAQKARMRELAGNYPPKTLK